MAPPRKSCADCKAIPIHKKGRCRTCYNLYQSDWRREHRAKLREYKQASLERQRNRFSPKTDPEIFAPIGQVPKSDILRFLSRVG